MMEIECLELGDFGTNSYVVRVDGEAKECLVIDPGFSPGPLLDFLQENQLQPVKILLTHGHCDHIAGIEAVQNQFGAIPVYVSGEDAPMLGDVKLNLSWMTGMALRCEADHELADGDVVELGGLQFRVLATPGHTTGGVSFYCEQARVVFSGDTLFAGSIGRDDFPGGNRQTLLSSIRDKLLPLPEETKVYSGHGPVTTIGEEKQTNPFL
jgi:hydroxyacylglutathione hydrolase